LALQPKYLAAICNDREILFFSRILGSDLDPMRRGISQNINTTDALPTLDNFPVIKPTTASVAPNPNAR